MDRRCASMVICTKVKKRKRINAKKTTCKSKGARCKLSILRYKRLKPAS